MYAPGYSKRDIFPYMMTLGQRIRALRESLRLTQADLALRCGWDTAGQGRIANYEKDRREPGIADLRKLASALNVSLMTLLDESGAVAEPEVPYGVDDFVIIAQYTAAGAAGNGHMNDHVEINGGLAFKRSWLQRNGLNPAFLHVIYVLGDSMESTITDGDVVLMDESQTEPHDNWIYVIRADGELLIKRLVRTPTGRWLIRSDNEDKRRYPDFEIHTACISDLEIVGRVVWHGGML